MKFPNSSNTDEFIPTRQSLLSRLKDWDDAESWREFFRTYWKLIYSVALKSGLTEVEAQEVVQETIIAISKQMRESRYDRARGSFKHWLLQMTNWRIQDQFRKRLRRGALIVEPASETGEQSSLANVADPAPLPSAVWEEEWKKNVVEAAIQRVKPRVKPRHFQIFDLYVLKQWPIRKVALTLGVNLAQVYLAKHRILLLIKREIKKIEANS